ncbi:polysaccharide pyruvyl transferase family protein [Verrucomicrobium spinosum]|uniref:polysaccharide pyruvyl transferase family protein n=1 Tax=Verrucomicrobium spinosum TaxID=2736 RepID=UPI0001746184|nr:polysaccharide pyruvyl transferase family protein [Verrucomicrobium spinosum]
MKIAFVGASGYGNVGDDTYPLVFQEQFRGAELLFFNSDLPAEMPSDLDLVVLGGGGIIYNSATHDESPSPHFRCMQFYMDHAIASGTPWGFLSCGLQLRARRDEYFRTDLAPWVPYLQQADFITVRSPECVQKIQDITGRKDGVSFFPDAAYLYRTHAPAPPAGGRPMLTVVPAGVINPHNQHNQHMVRLARSLDYEVVWMSMGAPVDDGTHLDNAQLLDPTVRIIRRPGPAAAYAQIGASRLVFTGRYHGMIFARAQGIPFYVSEDAPYKIRMEDLQADPADAQGHVETLKAAMERVQSGAKK